MMKALIGKQNRLPEELKKEILASPAKMMEESPAKMKKSAMKMKKPAGRGGALKMKKK